MILVFVFLGLILLIIFYNYRNEAKASKSWSSVVGEILQSNIETSDENDDTTYQAKIIYTYNVNNFPYQGSRIKIGVQWAMGRGDRDDIEQYLSKYPANQPVQIFYNSTSPHKAILEKGLHNNVFSVLFLSFLFLFVALLLVLNDLLINSGVE